MSRLSGYFTSALMCGGMLLATPSYAANSVQQQQFFESISALCGKAFSGKITAGGAEGDGFSGKPLIMHVRECTDKQLKIPFHVGADHSRTWIITQTDTGLRLKHDHRHKDGSEDKVTMYGGDTRDTGTANMQSFPVDAESIANFKQNGLSQSVTNVWQMMIEAHTFTYRLTRENRNFKVEFDLTKPVALPPVPWGHE
ncbi:hypothetical protein ACWXWU_16945 [Shewanella sp. A14]